jgi:hypothetical protein
MRRTHQALATLALGLALVTATTAAWATPPTGTQDQADQRRPLYQPQPDRNLQQRAQAGSEQERTLARHRALGAIAAQPATSEQERTLARHRALGTLDTIAAQPANAAQPAAKTDPAAPGPGVDLLATLLVGLVGGLLGGAAVVVGWTATTRRRRPRAAAGT